MIFGRVGRTRIYRAPASAMPDRERTGHFGFFRTFKELALHILEC